MPRGILTLFPEGYFIGLNSMSNLFLLLNIITKPFVEEMKRINSLYIETSFYETCNYTFLPGIL